MLWSKWNNLEIWGKSFTILFYSKFTSWFFFVFLFLAFRFGCLFWHLKKKKYYGSIQTNNKFLFFLFYLLNKIRSIKLHVIITITIILYVCRLKIHLYLLCVWQVGIYPFKQIIQLFMFFCLLFVFLPLSGLMWMYLFYCLFNIFLIFV